MTGHLILGNVTSEDVSDSRDVAPAPVSYGAASSLDNYILSFLCHFNGGGSICPRTLIYRGESCNHAPLNSCHSSPRRTFYIMFISGLHSELRRSAVTLRGYLKAGFDLYLGSGSHAARSTCSYSFRDFNRNTGMQNQAPKDPW